MLFILLIHIKHAKDMLYYFKYYKNYNKLMTKIPSNNFPGVSNSSPLYVLFELTNGFPASPFLLCGGSNIIHKLIIFVLVLWTGYENSLVKDEIGFVTYKIVRFSF